MTEEPGANQVDRLGAALAELKAAMLEELGPNISEPARLGLESALAQIGLMVSFLKGARSTASTPDPSLLE